MNVRIWKNTTIPFNVIVPNLENSIQFFHALTKSIDKLIQFFNYIGSLAKHVRTLGIKGLISLNSSGRKDIGQTHNTKDLSMSRKELI
jgi:hypothetical protein